MNRRSVGVSNEIPWSTRPNLDFSPAAASPQRDPLSHHATDISPAASCTPDAYRRRSRGTHRSPPYPVVASCHRHQPGRFLYTRRVPEAKPRNASSPTHIVIASLRRLSSAAFFGPDAYRRQSRGTRRSPHLHRYRITPPTSARPPFSDPTRTGGEAEERIVTDSHRYCIPKTPQLGRFFRTSNSCLFSGSVPAKRSRARRYASACDRNGSTSALSGARCLHRPSDCSSWAF